jgi:hypothetical protein
MSRIAIVDGIRTPFVFRGRQKAIDTAEAQI